MPTLEKTPELMRAWQDVISRIPLFQGIPKENLPKVLGMADPKHFAVEEVLVTQGNPADAFYILVEGAVGVYQERPNGERAMLTRLDPPSTIGEVGLLLGETRTATVIAEEESTALRFTKVVFKEMFAHIPGFGYAVCQAMAHRVDELSERIPLAHITQDFEPQAELQSLFPLAFIQRHRVLPVSRKGDRLIVGFLDPPSTEVLQGLYKLVPGREIIPVRIRQKHYRDYMKTRMGTVSQAEEPGAKVADSKEGRLEETVEITRTLQPLRLEKVLNRMVAEGASDLHLTASSNARWRIDGDLHILTDTQPLGPEEALSLLDPYLKSRHRQELETHHDTDFVFSTDDGRFRVNMYRDQHGVNAALRVLPRAILGFEDLGLPPVIRHFCNMPKGLVVVTGPTGSGKSTTLAAMIDFINTHRPCHILTLEDPIEYLHYHRKALIHQREVGSQTSSFARALRAGFREDPDIIMVGEMRDLETIELALEAANTGHLVLSTMHTNTAISTVDRIIDIFPKEAQQKVRVTIASELKAVIAQTLCKRKQGGRIGIFEIMHVTNPVANMIRQEKTIQIPSHMQSHKRDGHSLFQDELERLVRERKIDFKEALYKTTEKMDLARRLGVTLE
ncbi:MAG: PilT/PilU family type 4a pilus ATPase [Acidobacteriota bacterium]|nr:PilT/PilU family type 4a pilus ATPase [Acidobacteriota bacterium]